MKPQITDIKAVLGAKEFKRFGNFIRSPFFNIEERFIRLYDILEDDNVNLDSIADKFYGSKGITGELRFRKLVSEFMKLFNRFLGELEYEKDDFRQRIMLIKQLSSRNLKEAYTREANRAESAIDTGGIKDEEHYNKMLELYSFRYQAEGFSYGSWENDLSFKVDEYLNKYFADMKMFLFQRFQSMEYLFTQEKKINKMFLDEVNRYIIENKVDLVEEHSEIYLRYLIIKMITDPSDQELPVEYLSLLGSYEKTPGINCRVYYEDLLNFYTLLVNTGKREFENNIILVAETMEKRDYFKGRVDPNEFRIIIEAAIGTKKFSWAEEFAERNKDFITDKYRQNIFSGCMAKINFFKKDFNKARVFISQVTHDNIIYYSEAKLIDCRILYEEKEFAQLLTVIESSKKYFRDRKEIGILKESYMIFLGLLKKLIFIYESKLAGQDIGFQIRKLEDELAESKKLMYGNKWLIECLNDLKKGRL